MKNEKDEKLVANYLKGDEEALEILIKRYLNAIYSFVFHFVENSQEAEDLTQEIFIKAWKNIKKFNQKKSFKTWIFTIAKNTCLDWLKKRKNILFSELGDMVNSKSFIENVPDTTFSFNELLEKIDIAIFLDKTLERLSPEYRMILFLRYNDHLKFREIAEILEKPLNTVKSYHRRALILLRNYLKLKEK